MFRTCLATLAPCMSLMNCGGAGDLGVVKVSALYDPCSSQKRRKTQIEKIDKMSVKVHQRSVKVCKRSVKVCKRLVKDRSRSVKVCKRSVKVCKRSVKVRERSVKVRRASETFLFD